MPANISPNSAFHCPNCNQIIADKVALEHTISCTIGDISTKPCPICLDEIVEDDFDRHIVVCISEIFDTDEVEKDHIGSGYVAEDENHKDDADTSSTCPNNHNQNKKYTCSICSRAMNTLFNFRRHEQKCKNNQERQKKLDAGCPHCSLRDITNMGNLKRHIAACAAKIAQSSSSQASSQPLTCKLCDRHFQNQEGLKRHQDLGKCKTKKKKEQKLYKCERCDKSYRHKQSLYTHKRTCKMFLHKCLHCSAAFDTRFELLKHMKNCCPPSPSPEDKYSCLHCPCKFATKHDQYVHTHTKHKDLQTGYGKLQARPWGEDDMHAPWVSDEGQVDRNLRQAYEVDER